MTCAQSNWSACVQSTDQWYVRNVVFRLAATQIGHLVDHNPAPGEISWEIQKDLQTTRHEKKNNLKDTRRNSVIGVNRFVETTQIKQTIYYKELARDNRSTDVISYSLDLSLSLYRFMERISAFEQCCENGWDLQNLEYPIQQKW